MDIRNAKWHGQVAITGIGQPFNCSGSIMGILGEVARHLQSTNPRALADGQKEIVLRFRDKPFTSVKESTADMDKLIEIEAGLDDSSIDSGPRADEDYTSFVERLMLTGISIAAALMIAADWFDQEPPADLESWIQDSKAKRFRQLNASREAYESAMPGEYPQLKHYVITTYPQFVDGLNFREA